MAKILFSAVVGDARKKIGGVVFTKSRFGAIVRRKVSPVQPRTNAQRAVRANFTANSKEWSGLLTGPQRQAYTNLAAANPVKDRFGNSQVLTGAQMYNKVSRNLHTCGLLVLPTAPLSLSVDDPGGIALGELPVLSPLTLSAAANGSGGPNVLSQVAAAIAGVAIYTGTITGGAASAYAGQMFRVGGFAKDQNNGDYLCTGSDASTLTLEKPQAIDETLAASAVSLDTTYTGTVTGGAANALAGQEFAVAGFAGANNNGTFACVASTATKLTLANPAGSTEALAATATGVPSLVVSTPTTPAGGDFIAITATPPKNIGRTSLGKSYRLIAVVPGASLQPIGLTDAYTRKWGAPATGQNLNLGLYLISGINGAAGKPYTAPLLWS